MLRSRGQRVADAIARHFFLGMGLVAGGLGLWVALATALRLGPLQGQQPAAFAAVFAMSAAAAMAIAFWAAARSDLWRQRLGLLSVAALLGLSYIGVIVNIFVATRHPIDAEIAAVAAHLPENVRLVSIGPVDDVFLYNYGKPIQRVPASEGVGHKEPSWTYFCMGCGPNMPAFDKPYKSSAWFRSRPRIPTIRTTW